VSLLGCTGCEARDKVIDVLTAQLEAREKTLLSLVNQAALQARFPKERPAGAGSGPAPDPGRLRTSPAAIREQVYRATLTQEQIENEFRLEQALKGTAPPKTP